MWSKIVLISLLALNLEAGMISKAVKKAVVGKAKDVIVDKTKDKVKDKAKVTFKEKVMNNPKVKNKMDSTLTKLETSLNKKLLEQQTKRGLNGK